MFSPLCFSLKHEDSSSAGSGGRAELGYLEEERVRVLARIDELKTRLTELEQQLQESKQEVEQWMMLMGIGDIQHLFITFLLRKSSIAMTMLVSKPAGPTVCRCAVLPG